jgi:hypothetical protein
VPVPSQESGVNILSFSNKTFQKTSLKIPNQKPEIKEGQTIQWPKDRRTDNKMAKRQKERQYKGQKTEGQTIERQKDRRTDNKMAKRQKDRQYNGQKTEGQTIQWPKDRRTDNTMAKR